jgi:hypothetical protein
MSHDRDAFTLEVLVTIAQVRGGDDGDYTCQHTDHVSGNEQDRISLDQRIQHRRV